MVKHGTANQTMTLYKSARVLAGCINTGSPNTQVVNPNRLNFQHEVPNCSSSRVNSTVTYHATIPRSRNHRSSRWARGSRPSRAAMRARPANRQTICRPQSLTSTLSHTQFNPHLLVSGGLSDRLSTQQPTKARTSEGQGQEEGRVLSAGEVLQWRARGSGRRGATAGFPGGRGNKRCASAADKPAQDHDRRRPTGESIGDALERDNAGEEGCCGCAHRPDRAGCRYRSAGR
jgi:hypothetical protein